MPNYTLHYFNGRGRAEILRMMFHMAGVKYLDKRYEFSDWDRCRNGKEILLCVLSYPITIILVTFCPTLKIWFNFIDINEIHVHTIIQM